MQMACSLTSRLKGRHDADPRGASPEAGSFNLAVTKDWIEKFKKKHDALKLRSMQTLHASSHLGVK